MRFFGFGFVVRHDRWLCRYSPCYSPPHLCLFRPSDDGLFISIACWHNVEGGNSISGCPPAHKDVHMVRRIINLLLAWAFQGDFYIAFENR